jgi:hypothetical protein
MSFQLHDAAKFIDVKTLDFKYPHHRKLDAVKPGDQGRQAVFPEHELRCTGKMVVK